MQYTYHEGGNDLFASGDYMTVVDTLRDVAYQVNVVDFYIDDMNIGYVYFDGEEILQQNNIESYDVLERLFYSQFTVQM